MKDIDNYPFAFGALSAKVRLLGYDLARMGIISHADFDKVSELVTKYVDDAIEAANEYAKESKR